MSEKYEFIDAQYAAGLTARRVRADAPTLGQMCSWLAVSRSGFYEWRSRPMSATAARREELKTKIAALFELFDAVYGYRRIHAELVRDGEHVSAELVRKLMRELELYPCQPRPYRTTTIRGGEEPAGADLIGRDFDADRPGTKLVGDITYIRTWEGWLYLATVIDCFNREVIGYAMADHMRTDLITDALAMAARNHTVEPGCIFHSDRGSQYTSAAFFDALTHRTMRRSLSRTGICFDNALAESFFAALKNERVHRMTYPTRKKAAADIANYIEVFYNRRRIHSALGYQTPHEVRTDYLNSKLAA